MRLQMVISLDSETSGKPISWYGFGVVEWQYTQVDIIWVRSL